MKFTLEEAVELAKLIGGGGNVVTPTDAVTWEPTAAGCTPATIAGPWEVGTSYFVRTVTMHITGRLVSVHPTELVFEDAAWIADSGRFSDAIESGNFNEVEPFKRSIIIGRGAIVDATTVEFGLPRVKK